MQPVRRLIEEYQLGDVRSLNDPKVAYECLVVMDEKIDQRKVELLVVDNITRSKLEFIGDPYKKILDLNSCASHINQGLTRAQKIQA